MNAAPRPTASAAAPLPYGRQAIDAEDIAAVVAALASDHLAHGPRVGAFEAAFARAAGAGQAVACASGTAALHLAYRALEVGPGDVGIVPAVTFLSTATALRLCGANVVFADVDPVTGLMTPATLEEALARAGPAAKVVAPVHLAGRLCDVPALGGLARGRGLALVEDAAHAVGGVDGEGRPVGACAHSDAATFSFHPVKTLAAGEGGMVALNDAARAARMRRLANHGVTRDAALMREPGSFDDGSDATPWSYEQIELGFNYRMDEMSAALGLCQLGKLARFVARRRRLAGLYAERLRPLAPLVEPTPLGPGRPGLHLMTVAVDFQAAGVERAAVMRRMAGAGVRTQVHYIPLYRQPYFRALGGEMRLPGAEAYYARALALPLFPAMSDGDVERVAAALEAALAG